MLKALYKLVCWTNHTKYDRVKNASPRIPCFSNNLPFISTLISRGLYLFPLLLRCVDRHSQVCSLTVAELRRENHVFYCACMSMYQPTGCMLYPESQSTKLSSQINLFFLRLSLLRLFLLMRYHSIWLFAADAKWYLVVCSVILWNTIMDHRIMWLPASIAQY
jgi:hypothetical protein